VPQISQKIVDLNVFSERLEKMHWEVARAKLSCDAVRDVKIDVVLLSYVAEFERAEKAFRRISHALNELNEFAQREQLKASKDLDLCGLIEKQFGKDPAWESIREEVEQRLQTTSINVISELANEIFNCDHTHFGQLPDGKNKHMPPRAGDHSLNSSQLHQRREKKSALRSFLELCGFNPSVTVTPDPAMVTITAKDLSLVIRRKPLGRFGRGDVEPPLPAGKERIHAWPMHLRPDLANEMKFITVDKNEAQSMRELRLDRLNKVNLHMLRFLDEHKYTNPRTGQSTPPILIEELNYLRTSTVNALYNANLFTVSDLVTLDGDKPIDLRTVKRIAASKVLELQLGLSEVGIYRNGRAWFSLGKPADPLSVKDLPASPTLALMPMFKGAISAWEEIGVKVPLRELIAPKFTLIPEYEEGDDLHTIPGISELDVALLFGKQEKLKRIEHFRECHLGDLFFAALNATPDEVDPGDYLKIRKLLIKIVTRFACYKSTNAQDENGLSWYDHQFGHMPWLYDTEMDHSHEASDKAYRIHGCYGIPLSSYGTVKRDSPNYWKD
jgi:hypothetical protein